MAKRLICVIISVLMIVSLLPTSVFAEVDEDSPAQVEAVAEEEAEEGVDEGGGTAGEEPVEEEEEEENLGDGPVEGGDMEIPDDTVEIQRDGYTISGPTLGDIEDEIEDGDKITLIADCGETYTATISASDVTIDLAGYTLSQTITIASGASVTFTDSSEASTGTYTGTLTVSEGGTLIISSGTYSGTITNNGTLTITGGTFSSSSWGDAFASCVAEGYVATYDETTQTYTVSEVTVSYVATNTTTNTSYTTLQAAIDAASSGNTITLLASVTEDITIASDDNITLDLAGYTITGTGSSSVITVNGTLTLNDSTATSSTSSSGTVGTTLNSDGTYTTVYTETTYDSETDLLTTTYHSYTSGAITGGVGTSKKGGGVYINTGATLIMNGGTVYSNTLSSSTNSYGAGIAACESNLTINGGVVAGNTVTQGTSGGAGVYVLWGSFSMTGGAICNNTANATNGYGGGIYFLNGNKASVTYSITGGVISGNTARSGAGIYANNSTFTLSDATVISDNSIATSGTGGGITLADGAILNMTGGIIANNTASGNSSSFGGGIFLTANGTNKLNMSCGVIVGNTAVGGGGVTLSYSESNEFTMSGGFITKNTASYSSWSSASGTGGGVLIDGTFTMTGGAIYGNTASHAGADIATKDNDYSTITLIAASSMESADSSSFSNWVWYYDPVYDASAGDRYSKNGSNTEATSLNYSSTSGVYLYLIAAESDSFYLGVYGDTTSVPAEIASGEGEATMYVLVTSSNITNYSADTEEASGVYPTTSETFTVTSTSTADDGTEITTTTAHSYIFAGWYSASTDEDGKTTYTALTSVPTDSDAYAKFVDANVLTVKAQITSGTDANSETTSMRFVSTVDTVKYSLVGFSITVGSTTKDVTSSDVYENISGGSTVYSPSDFSDASTYFVTYTLKNIPKASFDAEIKVQACWKTQDGTMVYGPTYTFKVSDGYTKTSTDE
ncbi:MAG: hypothetical protein LUG49_05725 [Oscillospiraceae bacterium]|nr:hypothetical protein [Oscillospiraceae bacterium]